MLCYFPEVYTYFQIVNEEDELELRYLNSITINYCSFLLYKFWGKCSQVLFL